jgi:hypothetical protein
MVFDEKNKQKNQTYKHKTKHNTKNKTYKKQTYKKKYKNTLKNKLDTFNNYFMLKILKEFPNELEPLYLVDTKDEKSCTPYFRRLFFIYNNIISSKYYVNNNQYYIKKVYSFVIKQFIKSLGEIILHNYLINIKYRKFAQIRINNKFIKNNIIIFIEYCRDKYSKYFTTIYTLENIKDTYKNNMITYHHIYLYNTEKLKNNIIQDIIDDNEKGKLLGNFYFCSATTDIWKTYKTRIVIFYHNLEIFAQVCKDETIVKNMKTVLKIYNELYQIIMHQLFNSLNGASYTFRIEIYNYEKFENYQEGVLYS